MNQLLKLHIDNIAREKQPVNGAKGQDEATVYLYDIIDPDFGISALSMIDAIAQAGDVATLNIHINSPGGSVFESRAIMAALGRFNGKTVAHIDSLCASAATSIALACNEVVMLEGSLFMVHNASGMAWGDKNTMREVADLLEKIEISIVKDYTSKTGKDDAEIIEMMNAESWFTASEALAHGFIDRIDSGKGKTQNKWNLAAFANVPKALLEVEPEPEPDPEPPAMTGLLMSISNSNKLALAQAL